MKEVILEKDIERIGKAGDIIKVKDGYARNFLIPQGLALEVTPSNLRKLEEDKKQKESQREKVKQEAASLAEQLSGMSCTVTTEASDDDKLYGSITAMDIARAIEIEKNIKIDKKSVLLEEPIQTLGIYEVSVKLHPEVTTKVRVWVTRK
ncbi:MAG: 50S ribosomal protein L9 [Candidatus Omnitrophica bacterium]|nr:50S ribosomal protein L9 [Candidatus Omnitrophota bacterium]